MLDPENVSQARIAVLMAALDGEKFLDDQLRSLEAQTVPAIDIWAGDDGSSDGSLLLLKRWQTRWKKGAFHILAGPRKGFSENFRSLMMRSDIDADFFAFCDQDDVWDKDKLEIAVKQLSRNCADQPGLYASRTRIIDASGNQIGLSPLFKRQPSFRNAIVQNIGGGNTMLVNRPAWNIIREGARRTGFVSHDWWSYLLVSGAGGHVIYDPTPKTGYRRHEENLVGDNASIGARMDRLRRLLAGDFAVWNQRNIDSLEKCMDLLDRDSRKLFEEFKSIRQSVAFTALWGLARSGIRRQSLTDNAALFLAGMIGKL
ncbi:glycosyltransferase family 2 protein [Phyllobacterium phragmitis]|uniref:Glycosyltransferase family 2 protein n=1 Tax=Phyllobacterium phragmitis TaxID=2670329 RepID=A0A2S9IMF7_9HYPH|nr:glycosyltransferase family 2 protein [Phyllobacterium phragmitis]PRD41710.1 glycosyltransferase family 2 protein [Phyllobacterium phragmitis]